MFMLCCIGIVVFLVVLELVVTDNVYASCYAWAFYGPGLLLVAWAAKVFIPLIVFLVVSILSKLLYIVGGLVVGVLLLPWFVGLCSLIREYLQ